jgi:dCTP deaminase
MVLSNIEIVKAIEQGLLQIDPSPGNDPSRAPFGTTAVDLRLATEVLVPRPGPMAFDLTKPNIKDFLRAHSDRFTLTKDQPYRLRPNTFILANTMEVVSLPIVEGKGCLNARVEGRSSIARCGLLMHFTAPTIHAGFEGTITLEIINLGPADFLLTPEMYVCQLILERVDGSPVDAPNQFKGQRSPEGPATAARAPR